jgi:hypothetical protein
MCTATWLVKDGGYELFFNRDESVRRLEARPPAIQDVEGVRCLFPVDGDAGGTWLGVNEFGRTLGLLNGGERADPRAAPSRGWLVLDCLPARSAAELGERLDAAGLERFARFTLVSFGPGEEPLAFVWDGETLARASAVQPLCSSSLDRERARAERARAFQDALARRGALDAALLEEFHKSHAPERGPWSPCMHRPGAHTVSASHVVVGPASIAFRYASGPPCTSAFGAPLRLARVPTRAA